MSPCLPGCSVCQYTSYPGCPNSLSCAPPPSLVQKSLVQPAWSPFPSPTAVWYESVTFKATYMQDEGSCSLTVCEGSTSPWQWNMGFLSLQRGPVNHIVDGTAELLSRGAGEKLRVYHPGQETASPSSWPCLGQRAQLPQPAW